MENYRDDFCRFLIKFGDVIRDVVFLKSVSRRVQISIPRYEIFQLVKISILYIIENCTRIDEMHAATCETGAKDKICQ